MLMNKRVGIFGKSGYGKSTLLYELVLREIESGHRVIFHDWGNEYYFDSDLVDVRKYFCSDIDSDVPPLDIDFDEDANTTIVIDEADLFLLDVINKNRFSQLMRRGRQYGISVITSVQRPVNVITDVASQYTELYLFHTFFSNDVERFAKWIGKETAAKLPKLKQFEYLHIKI